MPPLYSPLLNMDTTDFFVYCLLLFTKSTILWILKQKIISRFFCQIVLISLCSESSIVSDPQRVYDTLQDVSGSAAYEIPGQYVFDHYLKRIRLAIQLFGILCVTLIAYLHTSCCSYNRNYKYIIVLTSLCAMNTFKTQHSTLSSDPGMIQATSSF